jgi:hypothetical protein
MQTPYLNCFAVRELRMLKQKLMETITGREHGRYHSREVNRCLDAVLKIGNRMGKDIMPVVDE